MTNRLRDVIEARRGDHGVDDVRGSRVRSPIYSDQSARSLGLPVSLPCLVPGAVDRPRALRRSLYHPDHTPSARRDPSPEAK